MPDVKILRPNVKVPGFHALIASISTGIEKNHIGQVYRYDGRHLEEGFFKTTRFAKQFMRAGRQLGNGYMVTIKPNFLEKDNEGKWCIRQWFCFNGENFIEMKTVKGIYVPTVHQIKKAIDKIELPMVPTSLD